MVQFTLTSQNFTIVLSLQYSIYILNGGNLSGIYFNEHSTVIIVIIIIIVIIVTLIDKRSFIDRFGILRRSVAAIIFLAIQYGFIHHSGICIHRIGICITLILRSRGAISIALLDELCRLSCSFGAVGRVIVVVIAA